MVRKATVALGLVGSLAAVAGAWSLYQRVETESVPYTTVATIGDVELRRYPPAVLVETTAPSENAAFRRLFRYISGENEGSRDVAMTTPVEVTGEGTTIPMTAPVAVTGGRRLPMTAPVERSQEDRGATVRMSFYLPSVYDFDTAPRPTNDDVDLVAVPERTLAVLRFSGRPSDRRVTTKTERLLSTLADTDVPTIGEPVFMGYDAPWTLPFLRRNEVAVEVEDGTGR